MGIPNYNVLYLSQSAGGARDACWTGTNEDASICICEASHDADSCTCRTFETYSIVQAVHWFHTGIVAVHS